MKTLMRIAAILLAVLLVSGITYFVGLSGYGAQAPGGRFEGGEGRRPDGEGRGGRDGRNTAQFLNARAWADFGRTLIPVALTIGVGAAITAALKSRLRTDTSSTLQRNAPS